MVCFSIRSWSCNKITILAVSCLQVIQWFRVFLDHLWWTSELFGWSSSIFVIRQLANRWNLHLFCKNLRFLFCTCVFLFFSQSDLYTVEPPFLTSREQPPLINEQKFPSQISCYSWNLFWVTTTTSGPYSLQFSFILNLPQRPSATTWHLIPSFPSLLRKLENMLL